MAANRAVSAALYTPNWEGTLPQGPKIQYPHPNFWLARKPKKVARPWLKFTVFVIKSHRLHSN